MSGVGEAIRSATPQVLARLVCLTHDLPTAEDAVQEAGDRSARSTWRLAVHGGQESPHRWASTSKHHRQARAADRRDESANTLVVTTSAATRDLGLVFNEGYWSAGDDGAIRADLCALSLSLAQSLNALLPDVPEVMALLGLIQLHEARMPARRDAMGHAVPLPEQDRRRWSAHHIEVGTALITRALSSGRPGPFQLEGAIAAVHCSARSAEDTDWTEIAKLYELLEAFRPTAVVRVNRAFAVGKAAGPRAGIALLAEAIDDPSLSAYPYALLVRGALHDEAGLSAAARQDFERAQHLARNDDERRAIGLRLRQLPLA